MTAPEFRVFSFGNENEEEEWDFLTRLKSALARRWQKFRWLFVLRSQLCNGLPTPHDLTAAVDGDRIKLTFQTLPGNPNDSGDPPDVQFERSVGGAPWEIAFWYGAGTPSGFHELHDYPWSPFDASGDPVTDRVCYRANHYTGNSVTGPHGCYSNSACVDLFTPSLPVPVKLSVTFMSGDTSTYTYRVRLRWESDQTDVAEFEILAAYYSNHGYGLPAGLDPSGHLATVSVPAGATGVDVFEHLDDVPLNAGRAYAVRTVSAGGSVGAKSIPVGIEVFEGF